MMTCQRLGAFVLALAAQTGVALAQNSNEIVLHNGAEIVFLFADPTVPGDLFWKAYKPEAALMTPSGMAEVDGIENVFVGSTDFTNGAVIWDFGLTTATPISGAGTISTHVPDFFTTGTITTLISLGSSGLPNPCSIMPSICPSGCAPPFIGFTVDILIGTGPGSGIPILADGVTGHALTAFAPPGMTQTGGPCGFGDYDFTGAHSTDEHQGDFAPPGSGNSFITGFQVGTPALSGPVPEDLYTVLDIELGLSEGVVQPVLRDLGAGYGLETGVSGLLVDTSSTTLELGVTVRDLQGIGQIVFPAASASLLTPPGPPGVFLPGLGATLLITPDAVFNGTFAAWSSTGLIQGVDTDGDTIPDDGVATTPLVPVAPMPGGASCFLQYFRIVSFAPVQAVESAAWQVKLDC